MLSSAVGLLAVLDESRGVEGYAHTFKKVTTVDLTRCDLEGDDMALGNKLEKASGVSIVAHTWASFRSLIGMPMVDWSFPMLDV